MSKGPVVPSQSPPGWPPQNNGQSGNGFTRTIRFARAMSAQAGVAVLIVGALELIAPADYKPSTMLGRFHGHEEATALQTKTEATVDLTRRSAEAQAREQAKVQWELEVLRQQMQTLHESMTAKSDQANAADWLCVIGQIAGRVNNPDARQLGGAMTSACGVGDALRAKQQAEYAELSRKYEALISRSGNTNTLNPGS